MIELQQPCLILEDDVCLSAQLPEFLAQLSQQHDIDFVTLETRSRKKVLSTACREIGAGVALQRLLLDRSGAAAYVLWPSGAQALLALEQRRGVALADAQICRAFSMRSYQTKPALAVQADCAGNYGLAEPFPVRSTIWNGPRELAPVKSAWLVVRFKWQRLVSQLRMFRRLCWLVLPGYQRVVPALEPTQFR